MLFVDKKNIVSLLLLSIDLSLLSNIQSKIQKLHLIISSFPPTNVRTSSHILINCFIVSVIICIFFLSSTNPKILTSYV